MTKSSKELPMTLLICVSLLVFHTLRQDSNRGSSRIAPEELHRSANSPTSTPLFHFFAGTHQFSSWLFHEWQTVFERDKLSDQFSDNLARQICEEQALDMETYGDNIVLTFIRYYSWANNIWLQNIS